MGIQTVRPNATLTNGWNAPINAATVHEALSDNNPASVGTAHPYTGLSYLLASTGSGDKDLTVEFGTIALGGTQRIEALRTRVWAATQSSGFAFSFESYIGDSTGFYNLNIGGVNVSYNVVTEFTGSWLQSTPGGGEWTQAAFDGLRGWLRAKDIGSTSPNVFEFFIDADVRTQPTVSAVTPTGTNPQNTRRPIVGWAYSDPDGGQQTSFQVKVFSSFQFGAVGFNPDSSTAMYNSGSVPNSSATSHQIGVSLPNGTWRAYVRAGKTFRGTYWYSPWVFSTFTVDDHPPAPTNLWPSNGTVENTDLPLLRATVQSSFYGERHTAFAPRVVAEWQFATDFGFTTNVRTIAEPSSNYRSSGNAVYQNQIHTQLYQGTWFIRVRARDEMGGISPWSAAGTFVVAHPPSTAQHNPTNDNSLVYGSNGLGTFSWLFTDTSPTDYQLYHQIIVEQNNDGTVVVDTGKISNFSGSAENYRASYGIVIPATYKDVQLRWKIRVWDSDDVVGPYSSYHLFRIGDVPTVTITSPADNGTATTPTAPVTFTFTPGVSGRTMRKYRAYWVKQGQIMYDTGFVTIIPVTDVNGNPVPPSPTTIVEPPRAIYSNGEAGSVSVEVTDTANLSSSDLNNFTVTYTGPAAPVFAVNSTLYSGSGYMQITWTRTPDGAFTAWRLYRRPVGSLQWDLLFETEVAGSGTGTYQDWAAASGVSYEYAMVQEAERFGTRVESVYNPSAAASGTNTEYWLIHPSDNTKNFHLYHVTSDNFSEEYEFANLNILGRGRKTDYGNRIGFIGSLTAQLYDQTAESARDQRLKLEVLKSERTFVYLRNPFGDLWAVTTSDIQINRMAGAGAREFSEVTIPYQEVIGQDILQ